MRFIYEPNTTRANGVVMYDVVDRCEGEHIAVNLYRINAMRITEALNEVYEQRAKALGHNR